MPPPPAKLRVPRSSLIDLGPDTVTVHLGDTQGGPKRVVHRRILERSDLCRRRMAACEKNDSFRLSTMSETLFDHYVNYAYLGTLATGQGDHINSSASLRAEHMMLSHLYKTGVKLEDAGFRNAVIDTIIDISFLKDENGKHQLPELGVYDGYQSARSMTRLCAIDLYVSLVDELSADTLPEAFVRDVLKRTLQKCDVKSEQGGFRGQPLRKCNYHEHPDGVKCEDAEVDAAS